MNHTPPSYAEVASSSIKGEIPVGEDVKHKGQPSSLSSRPNMPRQRSRGQIARRNSITRGGDARAERRAMKQRKKGIEADTMAASKAKLASASNKRQNTRSAERPWLGGLYFTDIIFIAFTYSVNLLRTLGLAELADIIFKGLVYVLTQLPLDMYRRWYLSIPPYEATLSSRHRTAAKIRRRRKRRQGQLNKSAYGTSSSSDSDPFDSFSVQPDVFASSHENGPEPEVVDQLSPFHHLVILLSRFACGNFPHLLPRVLFAEETIGPFVYWRTGGGSNAMVQEFADLTERGPIITDGESSIFSQTAPKELNDKPFRAYLLSKDARLPVEVQRANLASRRATTLLYLHGGGFSLGSVAFYAEALLRLRAKIALLESDGPNDAENPAAEARCVAVEYDLSPAARFPQPLLQCLRAYAHLIEVEKIHPESICLAGDSAGGNLAMGMLLCLDGQIHDESLFAERDWSKLPMPGKAVLISPWVDLRPSKAFAFSDLRRKKNGSFDAKEEKKETNKQQAFQDQMTIESDKTINAWTEAVAKYDWDFVASETLLHFAQVYTGVLPIPRRVHGPLGWIAHVCGVLSIEYESDEDLDHNNSPKGFMNPFRALSALSRPSRRIAKATHDALSDPILPRLLGLNLSGTGKGQSQMNTVSRYDSITAGFEPLFTPSDRRTDVVNDKGRLYESIEGPLSSSGADKIGMDQDATRNRLNARHLLDSHPLLSPTIGDWSRIKLKHGCLITWGERERMADDIEAWVDSVVNQNHSDSKNVASDVPAPDGQSQQTHQSHRQSGGSIDQFIDRQADEDDWIYTAVEKGPGGVHAWPFVSMYLAGSEGERERGLDLMARFIARTRMEFDESMTDDKLVGMENKDSSMSIPNSISLDLGPDVDPPHAAPDSEDDDSDSVGSMPSDVDLHGLVDDPVQDRGAKREDESLSKFNAVNIADAVRRAQELGYVNDHTVLRDKNNNENRRTPVDSGSSVSVDNNDTQTTPKMPVRTIKSGSAPISLSSPSQRVRMLQQQQQQQQQVSVPIEMERGRSRSPRKVVLTSPTAHHTVDSSSFIKNVHLHHPQQATLISPSVPAPQQLSIQTKPAPSIWWTAAADKSENNRQMAEENRNENVSSTSTSILPNTSLEVKIDEQEQRLANLNTDFPISPTDEDDETLEEEDEDQSYPEVHRPYGLDDIQEVSSEEALSPDRSLSPAHDEHDRQVTMSQRDQDLYSAGLARWAIRRPEPEGLSDIAEEGSVLSASITSNAGEGSRSRSLSPTGTWQADSNFTRTSLAEAATQMMQQPNKHLPIDNQQTPTSTPHKWRYLKDEIGMRARKMEDEEEDEDDLQNQAAGDRSFSPPARPQPGRSLPVVSSDSSSKTSSPKIESGEEEKKEENNKDDDGEGSVESGPSGAIGIQRKKPKGDVWW